MKVWGRKVKNEEKSIEEPEVPTHEEDNSTHINEGGILEGIIKEQTIMVKSIKVAKSEPMHCEDNENEAPGNLSEKIESDNELDTWERHKDIF